MSIITPTLFDETLKDWTRPIDSAVELPFYTHLDIFVLGESPMIRWRSFINVKNWHPHNFQNKLLKRKAFHGRAVWEWEMALAGTQTGDIIVQVIQQFIDLGYTELYAVDFEIASFQLTCGITGIRNNNHELMYEVAKDLFDAMIFISEMIFKLDPNPNKEAKRLRGELHREKPMRCQSKDELAQLVDELIVGLKEVMKRGKVICANEKARENFVHDMVIKLRKAIHGLDKILIVVNATHRVEILSVRPK